MFNEDEWWVQKCNRGLHGCGRLKHPWLQQRPTKQANFFTWAAGEPNKEIVSLSQRAASAATAATVKASNVNGEQRGGALRGERKRQPAIICARRSFPV